MQPLLSIKNNKLAKQRLQRWINNLWLSNIYKFLEYSEFETVMKELKFIKGELKILRERDESLKTK